IKAGDLSFFTKFKTIGKNIFFFNSKFLYNGYNKFLKAVRNDIDIITVLSKEFLIPKERWRYFLFKYFNQLGQMLFMSLKNSKALLQGFPEGNFSFHTFISKNF